MNRVVLLLLSASAGFLIGIGGADATLRFRISSPGELARHAGAIFAGTVTAMRSERAHGTIMTRVTFHDLKFAKGQAVADSTQIVFEGGTIDSEEVMIDGQPSLNVGTRYILFVAETADGQPRPRFPIVGLTDGQFEVHRTQGNQREFVANGDTPVIGFTAARMTILLPDSLGHGRRRARVEHFVDGPHEVVPERDDPGTRFTEDQFLDAVRGFLR